MSINIYLTIVILLFILVVILILDNFGIFKSKIPIYVVSLDREIERRKNIEFELRDVNYTLFSAVDGKNLTDVQSKMMNDYIMPETLNRGQIGCFLSHLSLWKNIVDKNIPHTLILEDDILVNGPINLLLPKLCKVEGYDILYLGHYFEPSKGDLVGYVGKYAIHNSTQPYCTHAYIITNEGAKKMIEYMNKNKSNMPIDNLMIKLYHEGKIKSMSIYPTIVDQNGSESTINEKKLK